MLAQVCADEIEIARKTAISMTQPPINAAVLKRAEDARRKRRDGKEREHRTIISLRRHAPLCGACASGLFFGRERGVAPRRVVGVTLQRESAGGGHALL